MGASGRSLDRQAAQYDVLLPWYAALGRRRSARATCVVLGDSWTEGHNVDSIDKRWVTRGAAALRAHLGIAPGGRGFIHPRFAVPNIVPPYVVAGATGAPNSWGPAKYLRTLGAGGSLTYTLNGTSADVLYSAGAACKDFTYAVDGGAPTNVPASAAGLFASGSVQRVSLGAAGVHTLALTGAAADAYIEGVIEYNGDENAGVIVHPVGHTGFMAGSAAGGASFTESVNTVSWRNSFAALAPDLVVIELGLNEYDQKVPAATYEANMGALVDHVRIAKPGVPVVLAAAPRAKTPAQLTPYEPWSNYVAALDRVAASRAPRVMVWDAGARLSAYETDTAAIWADSLHLNESGMGVLADSFARFLAP